jgi:chloramphenicol 3-O-phosphotransferase
LASKFNYQNKLINNKITKDKISLKNTHAYIFHLYCEGDQLLSRERARLNRPLGLAIAQQELMLQQNFNYDLVINNTQMSPEEVAEKIYKHILTNPPQVIK